MTEEWRDIPGYEGLYQASNLGRVKSLARSMVESHKDTRYVRSYPERILSQGDDGNGYKLCWLSIGGKGKSIRTRRLIALAFLPNPSSLPEVNHKDRNRSNNCVENLEWCTRLYNCHYGGAITRMSARIIARQNKEICQMDMDGNILAIYPSVKEATRLTGIFNISAAARGKLKSARGFKWRYMTDIKAREEALF